MSNPLLAARGLVKAHGSTPALRGASVELRAGEILAVTGASGSGKSTLLHCLAGIVRPDEGAVVYGGERLDQLPENRLSELRRTEFGVVFQFGQLIPELTALDNVALPLLLAGTSRKAAQERAGEWLERFGVRGQEESRPGELSGGQAQRVSLARALVTGPKAVFADEPTGALDSLAGEQVMTALTHTARESGTAVLLITHDAQVAAYADREVSLRDGVVIAAGHLPSGADTSAEVTR
ncbi:ABC transporter ATP-binding protein [Streptomyces avermitilis]|uniref:ABC transporter ATP-binding protein n=3 Tax=Streptomyces TaxID=1883 RepID=Q82CG2_STRAW|nr:MULTISPECIES: ABC transporter ATP-binding protein [Streptomyces]KUN52105.1 ABC transporter ATP-binding protein [Streptomyces avermitilis]MYT00972.1 ATP-binding cassette domain-containing protein [Streptomyces sp. SID5469]OOV30602.1 ABC transporter ATP-binding protein [Streptomyces avermitilis]BAC73100.1 putative ABC transporter ATP-binding protein [Streptomyces avermitilis MA-4680 = NBRC 14893]BBJ53530.1 macrolide ABC transporter ATP-binding protein [Streptomyces avermitilis]